MPLSLISVCFMCHRQMVDSRALGPELPPAPNHSHGVCVDCLPAYARQLGLSQTQIDDILSRMHAPKVLECGSPLPLS